MHDVMVGNQMEKSAQVLAVLVLPTTSMYVLCGLDTTHVNVIQQVDCKK